MILFIEIAIGAAWLAACIVAYRTRSNRPKQDRFQPSAVTEGDRNAAKEHYDNYADYNSALRTWFISFGLGALVLFMLHPEFVELLRQAGQFSVVIFLFLAGCFFQVLVALVNKFGAWQTYHAKGHGKDAHPFWEWVNEYFFIDQLVDLSTVAAFAMAIGIMVVAFVYNPENDLAEASTFQKPSITEVFNLRSRCADLGDKLLDQQRVGIGRALYADAKSHYDLKTNRCYVVVDVSTADLQDPNWKTTQRLYDGQTNENLAWFTTRGPAHSEDDKCMEYLDMPTNRTCQQINERILALMADSRRY